MSPAQGKIWLALARMNNVSPEIKTRLILVYFKRRTLTKELLPYARRLKCMRPHVRAMKCRHKAYIRVKSERRKSRLKVVTRKNREHRDSKHIRELVLLNATRRGVFSEV